MTPEEIGAAIQAFLGETCPACGSEKASRMDPFCTDCLDKLPRDLWARVTRREDYLQAFGPAMEYLSELHGGERWPGRSEPIGTPSR